MKKLETNEAKQLLIKSKGGMGNRLLCTITGLLYSKLSNRVPCVDWSDGVYGDNGLNVFENFFDYQDELISVEQIDNSDLVPSIWKNHLEKSVSAIISELYPNKHSSKTIHQKLSITVTSKIHSSKTVVFWHYVDRINYLKPLLKNTIYSDKNKLEIIKFFLRNELTLKRSINNRIIDYKANNWTKHMIGVHIRFTDRKSSLKKYINAINNQLKKNPNATVFLATDNSEVSVELSKLYKNIIETPKWMPAPGTPLHRSQSCPNKETSAVEALVDMYLLADCDSLIYAGNSTFTVVSRALSVAKDIVDIEKYNLFIKLKQLITELIP
jgi:hypothetical protein